MLPYPYDFALRIASHDGVRAHIVAPTGNRIASRAISQFASGYFGLATGYRLQTPPGIAAYITAPTCMPPATHLVSGVVETGWYPKPLFLVYRVPAPGETLSFEPDSPLALILPVPATPTAVRPMTTREVARIEREAAAYDDYLREHGELRWTSAEGHGFSHLYRLMSHRHRRNQPQLEVSP